MSKSAVEVLQAILDNPKDIGNVRSWTSPDVTYVSLNYSNPELKRVMPWCGTAQGPEVIVKTFVDVGRYWTVEAFEPKAVFGSGEHAAMFGSFTYRSVKLGKQVTSPFSVYARVVDGKCVYLQFMEDTFATARSFLESGAYRIKSNPDGSSVDV